MISKINEIYIAIVIIFILMSAAFYAYWFYVSRNHQIIEVPSIQMGVPSQSPVGSIATEAVDLSAIKSKIESNGKFFFQGDTIKGYILKESNNFEILAMVDNKPSLNFIISIKVIDNVQKAINDAEAEFLNILGIDNNQACQLGVSIEVSPETARPATGDYQLSFCPAGTVPSQ
jgi:hypothetical protein